MVLLLVTIFELMTLINRTHILIALRYINDSKDMKWFIHKYLLYLSNYKGIFWNKLRKRSTNNTSAVCLFVCFPRQLYNM